MDQTRSSIAGWIIIVTMLCQFIPLDRINPPVNRPVSLPPGVRSVMQSKCGQCHSNRTQWPKTAYVAPLSWYVVHEVHSARLAMNISDTPPTSGTEEGSPKKAIRNLLLSSNLSGHAPIPGFPSPALTESERKLLLDWARSPDNEPWPKSKNSARIVDPGQGD